MPISIRVNIDKIDKSKFYAGKKGRYLDLVLWETPESDYGDYLIKQSGEKGEKMPILGNAKNFTFKKNSDNKQPEKESPANNTTSDPW